MRRDASIDEAGDCSETKLTDWRRIMKRITKIALDAGAALSLGMAAAAVQAQPYGMMGGYGGHGPGMMGGYGPGYGMGPGAMGNGYGPGYGMGPGAMGGGYGPGYGMGPQNMTGNYPNAAANGLTGMKQQLGITAKQEPAWQAFADSQKKQDESRQAWFDKMREARANGSTQDMLAQQTEFMKQRQAEMNAHTTAMQNLYAALTPEQRAIADQRFGGFGPQYGAGYGRGYRGGRAR